MVDGSWKARRLVFRFPPFWRCSTLRPITSFTFPTPQKRGAAESPRLQKRGPQTRSAHRRGASRLLDVVICKSVGQWKGDTGLGREGRGKRTVQVPPSASVDLQGGWTGDWPATRRSHPRPTAHANTTAAKSRPRQKVPRARFPAPLPSVSAESEPDGRVVRAGLGQQPRCSRPSKTPRPAVAMLAMTRPVGLRIKHQSPHPRGDGCRHPSWTVRRRRPPLGCLVSPESQQATGCPAQVNLLCLWNWDRHQLPKSKRGPLWISRRPAGPWPFLRPFTTNKSQKGERENGWGGNILQNSDGRIAKPSPNPPSGSPAATGPGGRLGQLRCSRRPKGPVPRLSRPWPWTAAFALSMNGTIPPCYSHAVVEVKHRKTDEIRDDLPSALVTPFLPTHGSARSQLSHCSEGMNCFPGPISREPSRLSCARQE